MSEPKLDDQAMLRLVDAVRDTEARRRAARVKLSQAQDECAEAERAQGEAHNALYAALYPSRDIDPP